MGKRSRDKGAAGERELARLLFDHLGVRIRRNLEQSRAGGHDLEPEGDAPTVHALRAFALEVKRRRRVSDAELRQWWDQAERQAARCARYPALAWRADRSPWRVTVPLRALGPYTDACGWEWAATLSLDGFAHLVRERIER